MRHTTHRQLIEAAVAILSDGQPRTASGLSRVIREEHGLPHRCDRMADLMIAAAAEGVVKPTDRPKGMRSTAWVLGPTPLPDWLFVRERPAPEPAVEPEPATDSAKIDRILSGLTIVLQAALDFAARLDAIEATLADLTLDRTPRPLFDAARRNGH